MANNNWIKIESNVFKTAKYEDIIFLTQIFQWAPYESLPRYNYFVDFKSPNDIENNENFKRLPDLNKKFIREQFINAIQSGKRNNYNYLITDKKKRTNNEFTLNKSIRFFLTPVSIVLENSLNDSYFLNSIFTHFDEKKNGSSILNEYLKNGWVQYVNAGGWTNVENYVEGLMHSLISFTDNPNKYLRCFVLMDSDRLHKNFDISSKQELKQRLENKRIKVHILNKRAMENYMPDEVINELPNLNLIGGNRANIQEWVNVYKYLGEEQKDFLNYQKGFAKDDITKTNKSRNLQPQEVKVLFPLIQVNEKDITVSNIQYEILDKGLKNFPKFKDNFPKLFKDSPLVFKNSLLAREGGDNRKNEYLEIIQKINELL